MVLNPASVTKPGVVHLLARHTARGSDSGHLLSGLSEDRFLAGEVRHTPEDHIAVRRTDFEAIAGPAEHVRRGHRCAAAEEWIEDDVAGVGERLHEELDQRTWEGSRVRTLATLGLHLDHVARPRDAGEPAILIRGSLLARRRSASPGAEQPAPRGRLRVVRRVIEAIFRDVADRLRPELNLRLSAEVERNRPQLHADVKMFPSASV